MLLKFFFGFTIKGRDHIPKKGGFILASNHRSYIDPIALAAASPRKLNFVAREDLFTHPLFGRFLLTLGAFPVKRDSTDIFVIKESIHRLKKGMGLLLFPEATRVVDGATVEPKGGVGFLAVKSAAIIIPAFVSGTDKAWPKGAKRIQKSKICVHFGKPVQVEKGLSYQGVARAIMDDIHELASATREVENI